MLLLFLFVESGVVWAQSCVCGGGGAGAPVFNLPDQLFKTFSLSHGSLPASPQSKFNSADLFSIPRCPSIIISSYEDIHGPRMPGTNLFLNFTSERSGGVGNAVPPRFYAIGCTV